MKKSSLVLVCLTVFLVYQAWALYVTFNYPLIGINVARDAQGEWVIREFDYPDIADRQGLQLGDRVIAIDGRSPDEHWTVKDWRTIDQVNLILFQRQDLIFEVNTERLSASSTYDVTSLLAQLFSLFVAILLFRNSSTSISSRYLSFIFFDIALVFVSLPASIRGDTLGKLILTISMMLLPVVFYHFLSVFLKEKGNIRLPIRFLKWYYLVTISVSSIQLYYLIDVSYKFHLYEQMRIITLIFCVIGISANFLVLLQVYFRHRRQQSYVATIIKTVFWALFLSFAPIVVFSFIPNILFGHEWLNSLYMSWFVFLFPLTFVYLLATKRLYDIDMIVRRILFALTISLVPSLCFTGLAKLLMELASTERLVIFFALHLAGTTVVLYSLENLTIRFMPGIFPRKYRLQVALKKIAGNLTTISTLREMKQIILVDIVETLEVIGAAIVYQYKDSSTDIVVEGLLQEWEIKPLLEEDSQEQSDYTVVEVSRQEEYVSYLVIAPKKTNTHLGQEELHWLGLITSYLAVSLENVHLIRKLNRKLQKLSALIPDESEAKGLIWFRKLMFQLQEKERVRIAADLHDTTMQDLFFLRMKLQMLLDNYNCTDEDGVTLSKFLDHVDTINMSLRESCFELNPHLLQEIGLIGTLEKLIRTEQSACSFKLFFFPRGAVHVEKFDMEVKRNIFRIAQELLNNAKKHANAKVVTLSLYVENGTLVLEYEDDGAGFEPDSASVEDISSSGMGLVQMKNRILSMEGDYELDTQPGQGMRFLARLPRRVSRTA